MSCNTALPTSQQDVSTLKTARLSKYFIFVPYLKDLNEIFHVASHPITFEVVYLVTDGALGAGLDNCTCGNHENSDNGGSASTITNVASIVIGTLELQLAKMLTFDDDILLSTMSYTVDVGMSMNDKSIVRHGRSVAECEGNRISLQLTAQADVEEEHQWQTVAKPITLTSTLGRNFFVVTLLSLFALIIWIGQTDEGIAADGNGLRKAFLWSVGILIPFSDFNNSFDYPLRTIKWYNNYFNYSSLLQSRPMLSTLAHIPPMRTSLGTIAIPTTADQCCTYCYFSFSPN
ncbi:hypothetical protein EGR_09484 [Echinococcus granulosus]|uniref:Uncharacterized protein n=1 Tax=Echinococcus granulosus TaxID=6210 RepID=W6U539_ECHGR|nr:hypothetical protein EGR_09484 [Echinococcus granulosus]EUB55676.1 hypothetical protein EGR_09484 [Echinococcus granulosus]